MAYSDFTLQEVVQRFQPVLEAQHNLFAAVPDIIPGDFLCTILDENVPLADIEQVLREKKPFILRCKLDGIKKLQGRIIKWNRCALSVSITWA